MKPRLLLGTIVTMAILSACSPTPETWKLTFADGTTEIITYEDCKVTTHFESGGGYFQGAGVASAQLVSVICGNLGADFQEYRVEYVAQCIRAVRIR